MSSEGKNNCTYIQCQECGEIHRIQQRVEIDKLYVITECPHCGASTGLNLGNKQEDVYYYYNANFDSRYFDC